MSTGILASSLVPSSTPAHRTAVITLEGGSGSDRTARPSPRPAGADQRANSGRLVDEDVLTEMQRTQEDMKAMLSSRISFQNEVFADFKIKLTNLLHETELSRGSLDELRRSVRGIEKKLTASSGSKEVDGGVESDLKSLLRESIGMMHFLNTLQEAAVNEKDTEVTYHRPAYVTRAFGSLRTTEGNSSSSNLDDANRAGSKQQVPDGAAENGPESHWCEIQRAPVVLQPVPKSKYNRNAPPALSGAGIGSLSPAKPSFHSEGGREGAAPSQESGEEVPPANSPERQTSDHAPASPSSPFNLTTFDLLAGTPFESGAAAKTAARRVFGRSDTEFTNMSELNTIPPSRAIVGLLHAKGWHFEGYDAKLDHGKVDYCDYVSMVIILLNAIFMGIQLDTQLKHAIQQTPMPLWVSALDLTFACIYLVELLTRIIMTRQHFIFGRDRWWNLFDSCLVISSFLDWLINAYDLSFMRLMRTFRSLRLARMLRGFRSVRSVRIMLASVRTSIFSLFWAMVLLVVVIYMFALGILQGIFSQLQDNYDVLLIPELQDYYGTLALTLLSLFYSISGCDWDRYVAPLRHMHPLYLFAYIFFVTIIGFGVANILTAVFVESGKEIAEVDRDLVIQDDINKHESYVKQMMVLFKKVDTNNSGLVTKTQVAELLRNARVRYYMKLLEVDLTEVRGLFTLLDHNSTGRVNIEEFVLSMMRMKGNAKGVDLANIMYENRKIHVRLTALMRYVEDVLPRAPTNRQRMKEYVKEEYRRQLMKDAAVRAAVIRPIIDGAGSSTTV